MNKFIFLMVLFSVSSISLADAYRCNENGKIVYADHPCGSGSKAIKTMPDVGADKNRKSGDNYYSVENQVERIEQEKADLNLERREKNLAVEQMKTQKEQVEAGKNIDHAECEYYSARVREEEDNLRKGNQSREHRLSDESYLNLLRKSAEEYCR
jgi:predicted transposase YbfD/YdcC